MLHPFLYIGILFISIIIVILLIFNNIFMNVENFTTQAQKATTQAQKATTQAQSAQKSPCDIYKKALCDEKEDKGWYCDPKGTITWKDKHEYIKKRDECYFEFDELGGPDGACVKRKKEDSKDKYNSKDECTKRWKCDNVAGMCVQKPGKRADTDTSLEECSKTCKFKTNPDDTLKCLMLNPETDFDEKQVPNISGQVFDRKRWCEDRYECIDGTCVKYAGGSYPIKRLCEQDIALNMCKATPNRNVIKIVFDNDVSVFNNTRQISVTFMDKLKTIMLNKGRRIGIFDFDDKIVFETNKTHISMFFKRDIDEDTMNGIISDLRERTLVINVNFKPYTIVSLTFDTNNINLPTLPAIDSNKPHIYINVDIPQSDLKIKTKVLDKSFGDSINNPQTFQNNMVTKNKDFKEPLEMYLVNTIEKNEYIGDYSPNTNKKIVIFDLTEEYLHNLKFIPFVETRLINSIVKDYKNLKLLVIGTKDKFEFFDMVDEIFLVLYQDEYNTFMYRQLKIDLNLYMKYKFKYLEFNRNTSIEKVLINTSLLQTVFTQLKDNSQTPEYHDILFDSYNSTINIKIVLNYFFKSNLKNIEVYEEDTSLDPDNIICEFVAKGETIYSCKQLCYDGIENKTNTCKKSQCDEKCESCMSLDCKWNLMEYNRDLTLKPLRTKIKALAGNKSIKLSWIQPTSKAPVFQYFIIVENKDISNINIYVYKSQTEMNQFIIDSLKNGTAYDVSIISKNEFGVSIPSNTETIIPDSTKTFDKINKINYSKYNDSLERYYKNTDLDTTGSTISERVNNFEKQVVINELKNMLLTKLEFNNSNIFNVRVY